MLHSVPLVVAALGSFLIPAAAEANMAAPSHLRNAFVTSAPSLAALPVHPRQAGAICEASHTACADGTGCCPIGDACTSRSGIPLCEATCQLNVVRCTYPELVACCEPGYTCNYATPGICTPGPATPPLISWTLPVPSDPPAAPTSTSALTTEQPTSDDSSNAEPTSDESFNAEPTTSTPVAISTTSQVVTETSVDMNPTSDTALNTTTETTSETATETIAESSTSEPTNTQTAEAVTWNVGIKGLFTASFGVAIALWAM